MGCSNTCLKACSVFFVRQRMLAWLEVECLLALPAPADALLEQAQKWG
ncbi:hypothetical protein HRbin36_02528 [bacterium HR36]|nr:hypothetical protein HRbin36_02528 [bacterium HR36]